MQETWVQSLGLEGPLKKGTSTHSSILAMEKSMGSQSWTRLGDFHFFPPCGGRLGRAGREPRVSVQEVIEVQVGQESAKRLHWETHEDP